MKKPQLPHLNLNRNQLLALVVLGSFFGGALLSGIVFTLVQRQNLSVKIGGLRESDISTSVSEYKFIDPLIGLRGVENLGKYSDIRNQVASYITTQKSNGLIIASVDFRDIRQPGGFVLNPDEVYTPASLNKVPVMMAYYKIAESGSDIFSQKIEYPGTSDHNSVEQIRSAVQLTPGHSYTVEQLIEHMIRYSDNNAADLLIQHLKDTNNLSAYTAVFSDLGIDPSVLEQYTDNITAQKYSIFLRALFNATYLNRTDSEHAMQLLTETDFAEGIEGGVPNYILVAEKFGEVRMTDSNGTLLGKEINNCGVVYYPNHPYLLCIMTKGKGDNVPGLENVIASVSRIVYKGMQNLYP